MEQSGRRKMPPKGVKLKSRGPRPEAKLGAKALRFASPLFDLAWLGLAWELFASCGQHGSGVLIPEQQQQQQQQIVHR